jgi:hypothetical protein
MSARKCGCVYADARNNAHVRSGHELGGYLMKPCAEHSKPAEIEMNTTDVLADLDALHELVNRFGLHRFKSGERFEADDLTKSQEAGREADEIFQQIDAWACATRKRIAALVEAARVFDRMPHESIPDNVTIDFVMRAGQWRALSAALKGFGNG